MNRLQHESSPYLLQHAHNPVDWYAWKPEAFERARSEQKPILVSIGYSTCHWCHVMERESFENEDVAAFMNAHFINIKVDREERPDVDAIYMEACQLLTGSGGWPLNCFLTPDAKPFYAGTYFPPRPAHNRPGWLQLLQHFANIWETKRDTATDQAERLLANIQRNDGIFISAQPLRPNPSTFNHEATFTRIRAQFDHSEGGFGGAPKFPSTMALQWLLNWHHFSGNPEALEHALFSLEKMARGGIYDQIGGGFARYATDREWLVPHFEKMLYDNALLVSVFSEAYKIVGKGQGLTVNGQQSMVNGQQSMVNGQWSMVIQQTLGYIAREMTSPEGGFYSAQDADSEGVEGKFFVWEKSEIEKILGEEASLFCEFYGVTEAGNWEEKNILWRPYTYEAFAANNNIGVDDLKKRLKNSAEKLLAVRAQRIWPGLDNKILLGWNALMVSAYTAAFTALGHEEYKQAALRNLDFLQKNFQKGPPEKGAQKGWRHSASQDFAFLDDYAYLIAAFVDVYQVTFEEIYLQLAGECTDFVFAHFLDEESKMFFYTDKEQTDILFRKKDLYDNAIPSGNSTMVHNLQRLGILLDRPEWREAATGMLAAMRETVEKYPLSFQRWASAQLNETYPLHEIALVGDNAFEKALEIQRGFLPNKIIAASRREHSMPLLAEKSGRTDALIYVCRDFACQRPVSTVEDFWTLVNSK
ncbi:MAG: thioredoxin domain-containing protein [Saprospiraceae bacterium]|nr:thioredoxin domain-containing protein [Saprospiraceae bacterium]